MEIFLGINDKNKLMVRINNKEMKIYIFAYNFYFKFM